MEAFYRKLAEDAGFVDPDAVTLAIVAKKYTAVRTLAERLPDDFGWHEAPCGTVPEASDDER